MDRISRPKNTTIRSLADPMTMAPDAETSIEAVEFGPGPSSRTTQP